MVNEPFPRFVKYGFKTLHTLRPPGSQQRPPQ
jgi:hypothetical protein